MRSFITIFLLGFILNATSQPTAPILRIETGMHTATGRRISTDANGKYLLTCSDDKTSRLWDAATGTLIKTFRIPIGSTNEGMIYACSLSPDSKFAAIAGRTGSDWDSTFCIYIININTGEIIHRILGLPDIINDLEFSPDGNWLAAALKHGIGVRIFETRNWREYIKLEGYSGEVYNIAFKPSGGLATACYDGKIRMYNNRFELITEKTGLSGQKIYSLAFNPAGNLLAIGYIDTSAVEVRDAIDLSLLYKPSVEELENINVGFNILSFSANGNMLFGGGSFSKINKERNYWYNAIRCWNNAGKGNYIDLPIMKNTIKDIKPLTNGSVAVIGSYPDIVLINSFNKVSWYQSPPSNDFYADDVSHLRINNNGSSIGFTPMNQEAYSFNVLQRKLMEEQSLNPAPKDSNAGTTVTDCIDSYNPFLNGKKILFLHKNELAHCTDISSNGKIFVLGTGWNLYLSDNNGEKIWRTELPDGASAVNISGDDKLVTVALFDGTIRWYSTTDGKELLTFYLHADKKRWILFTPSGYYDASPGAEDLLGWHVNNGPDKAPNFYPVSRFRDQFYRPDIIDAIFETYNENDAITLANQRKGKINGPDQITDITKKLPPIISISSPANGSTVSSNMVSISYSINSPANAPARNIKVLVNGRPVAIEQGINIKEPGTRKIKVNIPQEDCTITLLTENDNGTSPEANLFIKWKEPDKPKQNVVVKPNLYLLAIGISTYNKDQYKLGFAAKDAGDFSSAILQQKGRLYNDVVVKTLTEKEASKINILDGLQWIQEKTTRRDVAMIFFAGHGVNDNNGIYYMLPVDADIERLRSTCINFEEIKQTQSTIEGKVIVFVDACHSGNLMGAGGNYINGLINLLTSTVRGAGAITFTSSTGKEFSLEDPSWGNGAFTKALIEGLNGAASVDEEKEITYTSLSLYISRRVKKITGDKQHPTLVPTPNTPDFPIALAK